MGLVRCYFLDENGHIIGAENFEAETVDAAISFGTELAEKRQRCDSIEIWRGAERLHPAPTSTVSSDRHTVAG